MQYTVLGSGNGARAWCAQIAGAGRSVTMWEPLEATEDYRKLEKEPQLFLEGDIETGGELASVTMDIGEAMKGSEMVLVVVPSFAHEPIFRKMIPHLVDGQTVVIVPGNFGGFRLLKMMGEAGCTADIAIAETDTMPYACRISAWNKVLCFKKKFKVNLGVMPVARTEPVVASLNELFSGYIEFVAAGNVLQVDMDNPNYVLHPFPVLLNYGDIEKNPSTFRHYMDGITPLISEQMEAMDQERIAVGKALGLDLDRCLDKLKEYYGDNDTTTLHEYVNSPESPYVDLVGQNVRSRYISEDVPGVLTPIIQLADKAGKKAPIASLVVDLASLLHDTDYYGGGSTLETLGIDRFSLEEIKSIVENGKYPS